ncbi:endonuclease/exonuclease/phosphatase family protein [Halobaculum halobium]|uniref:Endonuclease/exonuclease/phosphatase family protein n=1 Tax=Halobaculum halobium TaxID=3032281 RepID=A0ABD5TDW7_9EURY|nr:endonuclease/exonuclease/phosphatase family protein [Halobaculum sp. SYNS20]
MPSFNRTDSGYSRRGVLRGLAGAGIGVAGTAGATAAGDDGDGARPTVLTQNVYFGIDFSRLLAADSVRAFRRIVGEFVDEIEPRVYRARADAVAAAAAAADADVIALQEATLFRIQRPSDYGSQGSAAAEEVVDLLDEVDAALADRGLDFRRAAVTTTSDAELPATTDGGTADLRVTDRNAVLVREGLDVDSVETDTFAASPSIRMPDTDQTVALRRGYARADVSIGGGTVAAVSTHLESVSSVLRVLQASELVEALPTDRPVLLGGDFNSGPGTEPAAYDLLTDTFSDPFVRLDPSGEGHTCCQDPDLRNDRSQLNRRIDGVLRRGALRATSVGRVNHRRADQIDVRDRDEDRTATLWPSDHAGVVATFRSA